MKIGFPEIGVCGLSCRLCPMYHTNTESRCGGCKSEGRMKVGCPFITCAVKKKMVEFCWECAESTTCEKWARHRELGKTRDSFKCYQKLEDDISLIQVLGIAEFEILQTDKEQVLKEMLDGYNEGRSKSFYCIAATVMEIDELKRVLSEAREMSGGMNIRDKSKVMHKSINQVAQEKHYNLKLRK